MNLGRYIVRLVPAGLVVSFLLPVCGGAQGLRAVTRRTIMSPAPGVFFLNPRAPSAQNGVPVLQSVPVIRPVTPPMQRVIRAKTAAERAAIDRRVLAFERKLAHKGYAFAQCELGVRYLKGHGVKKDLAKAKHWLNAAAKQGDVLARKKLNELRDELASLDQGDRSPVAAKGAKSSRRRVPSPAAPVSDDLDP